ncbi:ATP-dependent DEAD/H RNA helicase, putative, partial [Trypanosoma cruzi marinkellei]
MSEFEGFRVLFLLIPFSLKKGTRTHRESERETQKFLLICIYNVLFCDFPFLFFFFSCVLLAFSIRRAMCAVA